MGAHKPWRGPAAVEEAIRAAARAFERDRYLSALLAPRDRRYDLVVLAAFSAEVSRIPVLVREPMMGEIRLQWWRDALEERDPGRRSGHPVADAIRMVAARHNLPAGLLIGMIDGQTCALYDDPPSDDQALAQYLAKTEAAQFELALRVLGPIGESARGAAATAGYSYGLARLLTELPALHAQGRTLIPASRLAAAGLASADLRAGVDAARLAPVLSHFVTEARGELARARRLFADLNLPQRVALLPLAVVEPYLRAFEKQGRDPLRVAPEISPLGRAWPLLRAHWAGRV